MSQDSRENSGVKTQISIGGWGETGVGAGAEKERKRERIY